MPLIPAVGRRSLKLRTVIFGVYAVLTLGSLTMVYPYMLMLSTSVCTLYDADHYALIPAYLHDDRALWRKYIFEKDELGRLGYEFGTLGYDEGFPKWLTKEDIDVLPPLGDWLNGKAGTPTLEQARRIQADFNAFLVELPLEWKAVWYVKSHARFDVYRMYQDWLRGQYTLEELGRRVGAIFDDWSMVFPPAQLLEQRSFYPVTGEDQDLWQRFLREALPAHYLRSQSLHYAWFYFIRRQPHEPGAVRNFETAAEYNALFGTQFRRITDITFPHAIPEATRARELRELFLREWLPLSMVRLRAPAEAFHDYLRDVYRSRDASSHPLSYYNAVHSTAYRDWHEIPLSPQPPQAPAERMDFNEFQFRKRPDGRYYCQLDWIEVVSPEAEFQQRLAAQYGDIEALNRAWGANYAAFGEIVFPTAIADMVAFMEHRSNIRLQFLLGNYRDVLQFVAGHGWAMWNTLFLVAAMVAASLTVNPMAAYALSRFRLKFTNQILIFLLATMAFPAEVAMIPSFLLVKDLGLLNTYWALILPGIANGFGIFLLKGFFDSLPPELYEAALIDGAGEMRMFWSITLPLSKPILAVIALGAFGAAYGSFMFAFLVCQDRDMWTLMVFLYEFQQQSSLPLVMASLVVASIPTLLVFIFCQNIILRGIVVPSFK